MDEASDDDFSTIWDDGAVERMLAVGKNAICVGTLRNVNVAVEIHIVDREPKIDLAKHDHVSEASFTVASGKVAVMGCTEYFPDAQCIELAQGHYRILSLASGIETIKTEWDPADDLYSVYLWPGDARVPRLIKHWKKYSEGRD